MMHSSKRCTGNTTTMHVCSLAVNWSCWFGNMSGLSVYNLLLNTKYARSSPRACTQYSKAVYQAMRCLSSRLCRVTLVQYQYPSKTTSSERNKTLPSTRLASSLDSLQRCQDFHRSLSLWKSLKYVQCFITARTHRDTVAPTSSNCQAWHKATQYNMSHAARHSYFPAIQAHSFVSSFILSKKRFDSSY